MLATNEMTIVSILYLNINIFNKMLFQSAIFGFDKGKHNPNDSLFSSFYISHVVQKFSYLAGMSPYISLKIKKRHYEHHMIEAHK